MPRKRTPLDQHLKQDRPGQMPRRNTWGWAALELLSPTHFTGTNKAYQTAVERYPNLDWDVYRRTLTSLGKRQLIQRIAIPGKPREMQQRRLVLD